MTEDGNIRIIKLRNEMCEHLQNGIFPYWTNKMQDNENGGFYGEIRGDETLVAQADKGAILNARILWAFSAAYRVLKNNEYLQMATRAKNYIIQHFYDSEFGGVYWSLNYKGEPHETKKQIYAIGFAIYGLSEYARATGDAEALEYAKKLFYSIEQYSFDNAKNGYCEALTRTWQPIADMRLSTKDANERKTMNTHLHILEPYTNLYRVWKNDDLKKQLRNLIEIFLDKILDAKSFHLNLFFDDEWNSKYNIISYGHDIEASWLLHEAALVLGDAELLARVKKVVPKIAEAAAEGLLPNGGMMDEKNSTTGKTNCDCDWWVQAETVVGFINIYQQFGNEKALEIAEKCWNFIQQNIIDHQNGEWHWSLRADGSLNTADDKAGFWKCPYHNSRMCLEIIERYQPE